MDNWDTLPDETPIDASGLKDKSVTNRRQLNAAEAENIRKAIVKYLSTKPNRRIAKFDYSWSLQLHGEMFGDVWEWAGELRTSDVNIGVPWQQVETLLFGLMGDLLCWERDEVDLLEQAVMLHHRAVAIHPFLNGNGRWSRLL